MLAEFKLTIIASVSTNNVIGATGKQLWKIGADRLRFKELTMGKTVIFGRKTYEGIGRQLTGRKILILSKQTVATLGDLEKLIPRNEEVMVAGGEEIYQLLLPYCQKMYLTRVNKNFDGDKHFPEISNEWKLMEKSSSTTDEKTGLEYWYETWVKTTG